MANETITVLHRHWGSGSEVWLPWTPQDAIKLLQNALDAIPEEYRDTAEISFEPDYEYGEHYAAMRVFYSRPETAEERRRRIADRRTDLELMIKGQERMLAERRAELAAVIAEAGE